MIVWITGQPSSGKSTLAKELKTKLAPKSCFVIDGDLFRNQTYNQDYSEYGRRINVERMMIRALEESHNHDYVIVAAVSPFIDQREWLKTKTNVKEVYLSSKRFKEGRMVDYYVPPKENFIGINTDQKNVDETVSTVLEYIYDYSDCSNG